MTVNTEIPGNGPAVEAVETAQEAENQAVQALQEAQATDAGAEELAALKAERESWKTEREALEARVTEAEHKASRVVPAPKTKVEKAAEPAKVEEPAKVKKARVSHRWFGDAAYED